jgi:hypothetical protein
VCANIWALCQAQGNIFPENGFSPPTTQSLEREVYYPHRFLAALLDWQCSELIV